MQELHLFCDVARHRSFSAAASDHDMTQSAVSQRIGALEKRLGVQLIDRSVRPLNLTTAGELFLHGARDLVERYEKLEASVSEFRPALSGEVRVDAIYSSGIDLLNQIKDEFESNHPHVTVVLEYKKPEEVYEAVREQRCDLGLVSYPQTWRDVGFLSLREERMVVVCAPGHPLSSRKRVHVGDLANHEMIAFEPELPVARSIRRYFKDHHVTPHFSAAFDNIDTIKGAVAMTGRIAILPRRTVAREALSGALVAVDLLPELARPVGIIFRRRGRASSVTANPTSVVSSLPAAAGAFVNFLLQHAGPNVDLMAQIEMQHRGIPKAGKAVESTTIANKSERLVGAK